MSPAAVDKPPPLPAAPSLFADTPEEELLAYGVPAEWLGEARAATEDTLLAHRSADTSPGLAAPLVKRPSIIRPADSDPRVT